jgi:beta-lactamase class A
VLVALLILPVGIAGSSPSPAAAATPVGRAGALYYETATSTGTLAIDRLSLSGPAARRQVAVVGNVTVYGIAVAGPWIYWSTASGPRARGAIMRAPLNGGSARTLVGGLTDAGSVVAAGRWVYFTDERSIARVALTGSHLRRDFIALPQERGGGVADGLATDGVHLYFSRCQDDTIGRVDLDGRDLRRAAIVLASRTCPQGIAVAGSRVYWTELGSGRIGRASLDGRSIDRRWLDTRSDQGPFQIVADRAHVYWTWGGEADTPSYTGRADADGSHLDRRFLVNSLYPMALSTAAAAAVPAGAAVARAAVAQRPRARAAAAACLVPGAGKPLDRIWRPDMRSAIGYVRGRSGDIAFAVRTAGAFEGYRPDHQEWSASVLKAMLLVAYLDRPSVAGRALTAADTSLLTPMITMSDNDAADAVDEIVGAAGLQALAARVGMTRFAAAEPIWGESEITPRDQTTFFLHIDRDVVARHRAYAMHLLASITPPQRWGIGEVAPKGWALYFKGGWGSGTGLIDNQVALLTRGCARVSIAVLTMDDGSHAYGKQTLKEVFARLLTGLPTGPHH